MTEALCHFTNAAAPGEDGWAMIAPYGDYPGMASIPQPDGSLRRVHALQRLDPQAAESMVRNFKSLWGRVKQYITGTPIYLGHPDGLGVGHKYPDKTPKGMFTDIEARAAGLFGKPVFTNEGLELLGKFPALSGRWTAEEIGEEERDGQRVKVFRPDVLKSAGLTDKPNLPVELLNEFEAAEQGQPKGRIMKKEKLLALLKKHGVELANDATDEQIEQAFDKLGADGKKLGDITNERDTLNTQLTAEKETAKTKDNTITTLTQERDKAKTDFTNERAAHRDALLDVALYEGRITPAEKGEWQKKLDTDFVNERANLLKRAPVTRTTTQTGDLGQRKAELANVQDRQSKVAELVNEAMTKNPRLSYEEAFSQVRKNNKALFDSMQQPQRLETRAA
jgi:hypothetical protein